MAGHNITVNTGSICIHCIVVIGTAAPPVHCGVLSPPCFSWFRGSPPRLPSRCPSSDTVLITGYDFLESPPGFAFSAEAPAGFGPPSRVRSMTYSPNDYSKLAKTVATPTPTLLHSLGSPAWLVSGAPLFGWLTHCAALYVARFTFDYIKR
jgi:hypothetical protein